MRSLFALLGVTAMITLAAPAFADPPPPVDGDDGGFLTALHQVGIQYSDPGAAVGSAKAVCTCLNSGESGLELVHDVKMHNPGMDMEKASNFAMIASKFYCPQQLSKS
jgi:Protein of unknown function (DUF732)